MKKTNYGVRLLLDWMLLLIGVLGSVLCLITAFRLPIPPGLWSVTAIAVTVNCLALGHGKWDRVMALILLAGVVLFFLLLRQELSASFLKLWALLSGTFAKGYDWIRDFVPRGELAPASLEPALLALALAESFLCCLSLRSWQRTAPCALGLLAGILPCFILTDTPPALLPLLAAVFSILTQALSQAVRRREAGEQGKAMVQSALLAAALLGALLWLFPRETYSPPLTWEELTEDLERLGEAQNNIGNLNAGLSGNPDTVVLSNLGALPTHPSTMLYVRAYRSGRLYLRGSAYAGFDGKRWRREQDQTWIQAAVYPYLGQAGGSNLIVETVHDESVFYTTYQTTGLPAGAEPVADAYLANPGKSRRYSLTYISAPTAVSPDPDYDAWVRETCLELPDETRQAVLDWWRSRGGAMPPSVGALSSETQVLLPETRGGIIDYTYAQVYTGEQAAAMLMEQYVQQVASTVSTVARYSRNPLRAPADADFCTWFLNEAEEGYCVHYATACTALLRALGIPARYVTGYTCFTEADSTVTVTNLQAHAWVEAWIGGRWVCVEATPNTATELGGRGESGTETQPIDSEAPTVPETTAPRSTGETLIDMTEKPVPGTRPVVNPTASAEKGHVIPEEPPKPAEPVDYTLLWVFLGTVGLLALVLGRRALALRHWEKRLAQAAPNERARLLWRRMLRLSRHGGGEPSPEAEALAKKAAFSRHTLTEEELTLLRRDYRRLVCRVDRTKLRNRLYCRYVLAIV